MKKKILGGLSDFQTIKNNMNELKQNSSFKAIFFIVVVIFFTYLFIAQSLTVVQLRYQMADIQAELIDKENDNKILVEQIEKKTTDQYIEETARTQLGMVKSDEVPVKVIEKEKKTEKVARVEPKDKVGIYMKDWYVEMEEYMNFLKKR